jgi:hypothetical protein
LSEGTDNIPGFSVWSITIPEEFSSGTGERSLSGIMHGNENSRSVQEEYNVATRVDAATIGKYDW